MASISIARRVGMPLQPPTENLQPANGRTFSEPALATPPIAHFSANRGEREKMLIPQRTK
jgi:hypothetical protein